MTLTLLLKMRALGCLIPQCARARHRPLVLFAVAVLSELRLRVETEVAGGAVVLARWSAVDAEVLSLQKHN